MKSSSRGVKNTGKIKAWCLVACCNVGSRWVGGSWVGGSKSPRPQPPLPPPSSPPLTPTPPVHSRAYKLRHTEAHNPRSHAHALTHRQVMGGEVNKGPVARTRTHERARAHPRTNTHTRTGDGQRCGSVRGVGNGSTAAGSRRAADPSPHPPQSPLRRPGGGLGSNRRSKLWSKQWSKHRAERVVRDALHGPGRWEWLEED